MYRRAERPRVAVALTVLALFVVVALTATGVMIGKASVDQGSSRLQLQNATTSAADVTREIRTVTTDRDQRLGDLEARRQSALTRARQWRTRARRAERGLRTSVAAKRAAAKRRASSAKKRAASSSGAAAAARKRTPRRSTPPPPPPPPAVVVRPRPPPAQLTPAPPCDFPPC